MKHYFTYLETEAPSGSNIDSRNRSEMIRRNNGALFVTTCTRHASSPVARIILVQIRRRLGFLLALLQFLTRFDNFAAIVLAFRTVPVVYLIL